MNPNEIITVGLLGHTEGCSERIHLQDYVYSEIGVAPTLTARDYKDARKILIRKDRYERNITEDCSSSC